MKRYDLEVVKEAIKQIEIIKKNNYMKMSEKQQKQIDDVLYKSYCILSSMLDSKNIISGDYDD